jgi:predicted HTH domain antitoxin
MEIKKLEKPNPETGEMEVTFALTKEQTEVLLEFAINMLIAKGLVSFSNEAVAANAPSNDEIVELMKRTDPKDFPQA